ncbi:hypothetical protein TRFO_08506 [Tritrichomonas foetus]|uniref:Uncharacterized protein n=1 Tax=Tritrichomonas foetus TaxID=1144522 RepID=A0A1J4JKU1_9EUKA|nr:hypothetical protein TRFO_08506 [Tritrichomonas foetus]|eukprot:OHS99257.1 hypothetical protein TRFO_08506 [Tritrichomonas foetus]
MKFEKSQLSAEKVNLSEHSTIINAKIDLLHSEIKHLKETSKNLKSQNAEINQKNLELSDLLLKASKKITNYKNEISTLQMLQNKVNNSQENSIDYQEQINQLKLQLTNYENVVREQDEHIKRIVEDKKELKEKIKDLVKQNHSNDNKSQKSYVQRNDFNEYQIKMNHVETENQRLIKQVQHYQLLLNKANDFETENIKLHDLLVKLDNEKKLLQSTIEDYRIKQAQTDKIVQAKTEYEAEIEILKSKLKKNEEFEVKNREIENEMKKMKEQNNILQLNNSKLQDQINDLKFVAVEQEKIKRDIVQFEVEIQEREIREQNLSKKYRYYKQKAREQLAVIDNFQTKTNDITNELIRIKEREAQKEAALKQKERYGNEKNANLVKLSRELMHEKAKNARLEMRVKDKQREISMLSNNI